MAARKTKKATAEVESKQVDAPFEESIRRLSEIVDQLESGELTLEESLGRFEEGVGLAKKTQAQLDAAEAKVEKLLSVDDDGNSTTEDIEER